MESDSGRCTTSAEDAQGTSTQNRVSQSILVYEHTPLDSETPTLGILVNEEIENMLVYED